MSSEFGDRLRQLRSNKARTLDPPKLSQEDVAQALGVGTATYGNWERGDREPNIVMLPEIADYFGESIDYLLGYKLKSRSELEGKTNLSLTWSLCRSPQTKEEEIGVEIWQRLVKGEDPASVVIALGTPKWEIHRYLQDIIRERLISIDFQPYDTNLDKLLQEKFKPKLKQVLIVPNLEKVPYYLKNIVLGQAARHYFRTNVSGYGRTVGFAGGSSVHSMIYSLKRGECKSITAYPLTISPVTEAIAFDANTLVGTFMSRHTGYEVSGYALQYSTSFEKQKNEHTLPTSHVLGKAKTVDFAFMGVGVVGLKRKQNRHWAFDMLGEILQVGPELDELRERKAVGDILYHWIDEEGELAYPEASKLICGLRPQDLREMIIHLGTRVVVITSGYEKVEILRIAINQGYTNVLIIDEALAKALLESGS